MAIRPAKLSHENDLNSFFSYNIVERFYVEINLGFKTNLLEAKIKRTEAVKFTVRGYSPVPFFLLLTMLGIVIKKYFRRFNLIRRFKPIRLSN